MIGDEVREGAVRSQGRVGSKDRASLAVVEPGRGPSEVEEDKEDTCTEVRRKLPVVAADASEVRVPEEPDPDLDRKASGRKEEEGAGGRCTARRR